MKMEIYGDYYLSKFHLGELDPSEMVEKKNRIRFTKTKASYNSKECWLSIRLTRVL